MWGEKIVQCPVCTFSTVGIFLYSKELCLFSLTCNVGLKFIVLGQALRI